MPNGLRFRYPVEKKSEKSVFRFSSTMRSLCGCRYCGTKSSSLFRKWAGCCQLGGWQGVEMSKPMSAVVCNNCHQRARRDTLKVRAMHVTQVLMCFARTCEFSLRIFRFMCSSSLFNLVLVITLVCVKVFQENTCSLTSINCFALLALLYLRQHRL